MSIDPSDLDGVEWVDVSTRAVVAPTAMLLRVVKAARSTQHSEIRGAPSAAALRWFKERNIARIRVRLSSDGRFVALEGTETSGSAIAMDGNSFRCTVTLPSDMPVGAQVQLSPFGRTLIGLYPHKEDQT